MRSHLGGLAQVYLCPLRAAPITFWTQPLLGRGLSQTPFLCMPSSQQRAWHRESSQKGWDEGDGSEDKDTNHLCYLVVSLTLRPNPCLQKPASSPPESQPTTS